MSSHLDYEINKELGECYLFMGDYDKAENYYKKAASSNGVHPDPYLGLATIAVQRGKLEEALGLYKHAIGIAPDDKGYTGAGIVHMEMNALKDAMEHFEKALAHNPSNAIALNCLVRLGYQLGCVEKVVPFIEASMQANPEHEQVRITLAGCLFTIGRHEDARSQLESALEINPASVEAKELFDHIAAA